MKPSKDSVSILLWIQSYQNHALYSSVYLAVGWRCFNAAFLDNDSDPELAYHWKLVCWLGAAVAALMLYLELSYMVKRSRMPPGDSGWPIVGHLPPLIQDSEAFFVRKFSQYGDIMTVSAFFTPIVNVTTDEDVQWAMAMERKGKAKALMLSHFLKLLGEESIMAKAGEEHRRLRKIFEPAFSPMAIRDYAPAIDEITQEALKKWCKSGEFQTPREWALLAMRIFFVCAFGEADEKRMEKLTFLFESWTAGFRTLNPFRIPGTVLHRAHYFKEELGREMMSMITEFKKQNPPGSKAAQTSVMGRLCYAKDEEGNPPTDEQLVDNLRFFLVAGFDTTKASFAGISHFVKRDAHLESALVEEVRNLKDPLDIDELKHNAPILNAVLAETWRMTAPLSTHTTVTLEDLHLKGYTIPKDSFLNFDIQAHNVTNNQRYPDAANFHFERWLPKEHPLYKPEFANAEEIDYNVMNYKYRSFNLGSHMCLGGHFARLEVRIVVARLFQSYNIEIRNEFMKTFPVKQRLNEFRLSSREAREG